MQAVAKKRTKWFWVRWGLNMALTYAVLIGLAVVLVTPFLYMLSISLRPGFSFMTFPLSLIPEQVSLENYQILFSQSRIARWIFNSVFVATAVTLLQLFTSSLAGYAFSRGDFPGRDAIFWVFMGTMMVPGTVTIVPTFLLMSKLGWVDTFWVLIIPLATSTFGTFLCRQSFKSIPRDYDDAALIDGANRFGIYRRILLPLIKPTLATLATLTFLGQWNSFMYPLIMTNSAKMRTLTVGLTTLVVREGGAGVSMASATLSFTPTFLIFLFMQRYVVQGITMSGVKG
jgi:multiple sugar transport system permease protein